MSHNLSKCDNNLKTTTYENVEDRLDDLDLTNQDSVNHLDGTTESNDLIDLRGSDVPLSLESRFHFDNIETIMF